MSLHLSRLNLLHFRNHREADVELGPEVNCFVGPNGVGKTNLLDAVHYLSLAKSYEPRNPNRQDAAKYLAEIRQLLAEGKQKAAEQLAETHFMGLKTQAGNKEQWTSDMLGLKGLKGNPALPDYDDATWETMVVPAYEGWETVGFEGLDGAVWLRTVVDIPVNWQGKNVAGFEPRS